MILGTLCFLLGATLMWTAIVYHNVWVNRRQPVYKNPPDDGRWKRIDMVNLDGGRTRVHGD